MGFSILSINTFQLLRMPTNIAQRSLKLQLLLRNPKYLTNVQQFSELSLKSECNAFSLPPISSKVFFICSCTASLYMSLLSLVSTALYALSMASLNAFISYKIASSSTRFLHSSSTTSNTSTQCNKLG
eukprot:1156290_1